MEPVRVLLVPDLTEVEWTIRPLVGQWAEVASYDAPGVGGEPPVPDFGTRATGRRGLEEIERRGWERCVVVADEFGVTSAVEIAAEAPGVVQAMALGHARLTNRLDGERPPLNREVHAGCASLIRNDARTFVRQMFRMTSGALMEGGYGDELADEYRRRVPDELMLYSWEADPREGDRIAEVLGDFDAPLLLAQHEGCLLFTDDGFEDAARAWPHAQTVKVGDKPSTSPEFARALEVFCRERLAVSA